MARKVAKFIADHGLPEIVRSDQEREFVNEAMTNLLKLLEWIIVLLQHTLLERKALRNRMSQSRSERLNGWLGMKSLDGVSTLVPHNWL